MNANASNLCDFMSYDDENLKIDRRLLDEAEINRLAALEPMAYERERDAAAEKLDVRIGALDEAVKKKRKVDDKNGEGNAISFSETQPWHKVVDGCQLLDEIKETIQRYVVMDEACAVTVGLWVVFTHVFQSFHICPRLAITSPEKQCGKTTLLDILTGLVCRALSMANVTSAAVFRMTDAHKPSLLIDEADTFLANNDELRGVLNSGHRRGGSVVRLVGDKHEPKQFGTWSPCAIAMIGKLPDTLQDRSVPVRLRRRKSEEPVSSFRLDSVNGLKELNSKIVRWAHDNQKFLGQAYPEIPGGLYNRVADNWGPILAIADIIGGRWPQLARIAALKLSGAEQESRSVPNELLADIRDFFEKKGIDRVSTNELLQALTSDELKLWATFNKGKPMSPHQLAKRLTEYGIKPKSVRIGEATPKGYELKQFKDTFDRYLTLASIPNATPQQEEEKPIISVVLPVANDPRHNGSDNQSATLKAVEMLGCGGVADKSGSRVEVTI